MQQVSIVIGSTSLLPPSGLYWKPGSCRRGSELELHSWPAPYFESNDFFEFDDDANRVHALVDGVNCPGDEKVQWKEDLEAGMADAWLTLLLPRLTSLEKPNMIWPFGRREVQYIAPWHFQEHCVMQHRSTTIGSRGFLPSLWT